MIVLEPIIRPAGSVAIGRVASRMQRWLARLVENPLMRKIAVCIKQIPLIEDANFDAATRTIKRDGPNVISAFDLRAISLAAELKQKFGCETVVATMGPPQARSALADALAMGMDRAVHLEDRAFAGSDTLATARALAAWLGRENFDLILMGKYSLDAETGQVGPEIAELLGIAQVTGVRKLEIDGSTLRAERESDEGFDEVEAVMPALITCAERVAQPIKLKPGAVEQAKGRSVTAVRASELSDDPKLFGLAGSPTWVEEIRFQEPIKVVGRTVDPTEPKKAAAEVLQLLEACGALRPRAPAHDSVSPHVRLAAKGKDIVVACETDHHGRIARATLELLSQSGRLATRLKGSVIALLIASPAPQHAGLLASYGADEIATLDCAALRSYSPDATAAAVADFVATRTPWGLFLTASERGRDWGPRLAAKLNLGLTGDAIGLDLDSEDRLVALKPAFGGNVIAPILSKTYPQMATVRAGVLELSTPAHSRIARVTTIQSDLREPLSFTVRSHAVLDETLAPLEGANIVVGIGTGVGGPEGVATIKQLAHALDAALCATRRVTDAGWVPRQLQVGLTGKAIDPRLYFAIGIRGVPNHVVGIKRAHTVVAINNDPDAPIFDRAAIKIVADWSVIVPALTDAFRSRRAA
jgi:electron transfer flavoprotein alpha subunit